MHVPSLISRSYLVANPRMADLLKGSKGGVDLDKRGWWGPGKTKGKENWSGCNKKIKIKK